jgi:hypothetical protein
MKPFAIRLTQSREITELEWGSILKIVQTFGRTFAKLTGVLMNKQQKARLAKYLEQA